MNLCISLNFEIYCIGSLITVNRNYWDFFYFNSKSFFGGLKVKKSLIFIELYILYPFHFTSLETTIIEIYFNDYLFSSLLDVRILFTSFNLEF